MQSIKCSAAVLAALITAVAIWQGVAKADRKVVKPTPATLSPRVPRPASGIVSANPVDTESPQYKQREAIFEPSSRYARQARALYEAGDLAGTEAACLSALDAAPVLQGKRQPVLFVGHLLGQVYLKEGQYQKAIHWLRGAQANETVVGPGLDLDVALAYVRLGDYAHARKFYSDKAILQYYEQGTPKDLPGTATPQALEASILLARGQDALLEHRYDDALPDLHRAHQLAPGNALIAYDCAKILADKGQSADATRLYGRAIATSHGIIHDDALRHYAGGDRAVRAEPARPSTEPLF